MEEFVDEMNGMMQSMFLCLICEWYLYSDDMNLQYCFVELFYIGQFEFYKRANSEEGQMCCFILKADSLSG